MQKETIIQGMLMCLSYLGHLCLDLLVCVHGPPADEGGSLAPPHPHTHNTCS